MNFKHLFFLSAAAAAVTPTNSRLETVLSCGPAVLSGCMSLGLFGISLMESPGWANCDER